MRIVEYNPHPEHYISVTHYEFEIRDYLLTVSLNQHRLASVELGISYNQVLGELTISLLWFGFTFSLLKRHDTI